MRKVPAKLFADTDAWNVKARELLDLFESNSDKPNFINYGMLESKDANAYDTIVVGE
jgi:hypothetical protein